MNSKLEIPIWCIKNMLVWIEIRDKQEQQVLEYLEGTVTVADHEKKILKVKFATTEEEKEMRVDRVFERLEKHEIIDDLADIPVLNDAELLKHLEVRYKNDLIHCFCGPTLIVINPYKKVEHEENEEKKNLILKHLREHRLKDIPPHNWSISSRCYHHLFKDGKNQAICISGESGAGKTESTKRCMAFITQMNSTRKSVLAVPIEDKILSCNPLLEAFGNAKTFRNDNSSRFGKYTVLYLDKESKKVKGASIENYLLEKSRICIQNKEERNYHIFYAMCRFADPEKLKRLKLSDGGEVDMKRFNYLNQSGIYSHPKIDDKEFYDEVSQSFNDLDFSKDLQEAIWKTLSVILFLGNVKIDEANFEEGSKPCKIVRDSTWNNIVELLAVDQDMFEEALTHRELKIGNQVTKSPLSPQRTKNSIDSIAKELYNRMFNWVIKKLNKTLLPENPDNPDMGTIGILDIFGFEIFEKNSIEQFFINYANERLQSLYIEYIFKNECTIFEDEGLGEYTSNIVYKDNKPCVMSLDNTKLPPGVFDLIDQACALNKSDEYLHAEIKKNHKTSQSIKFPRFSKHLSFIVIHTARDVEYITDSFVEKNKDELSLFLKKALETGDKYIVGVFNETAGLNLKPQQHDPNARVNPKEKYLGFKFRRDMHSLVNQLIKCECHFIRCIKPNEFKKADFWNAHLALLQVQYMGLLDSLKVRKMSYPFRFTYKKFFEVYQDLDMGENGAKNFTTLEQSGADFVKLTREIVKFCGIEHSEKDLLYGSTKIFLNEKFRNELDKALMMKQKNKKEALNIIARLYLNYKRRTKVNDYFKTTQRSIVIARDLLKSSTAKLDGLRFKNYLKIVSKFQQKFLFIKAKRERREKMQKIELIVKFAKLRKLQRLCKFILKFKRRVQTMQAMMNKKIKDQKNILCRNMIKDLFDKAWKNISKVIVENSIQDIQRTFRSHLKRKNLNSEYSKLKKIVVESKTENAAISFQRFIRGYLVRTRIYQLNKSASKIQGFFRMKWMRNYFLRLCKAIVVIQRFFKKYYIRHQQSKADLKIFLNQYQNQNESVARFERDILFASTKTNKVNNYTNLPFQQQNEIDVKKNNYQLFLPKVPEIELKPKSKFTSILIDLDVVVDTSNIYPNTWSNEFLEFLKQIHQNNSRLLHLEVGEGFTIGITDDKQIYSWGLNDYSQCARAEQNFNLNVKQVKNLSANSAKLLQIGKDHGLMVDKGNNLYSWGRNSEGQLGLGHTRKSFNIHILSEIKEQIKSIAVKDNTNYVLTESGNIYKWPDYKNSEHILKPQLLEMPKNNKINHISAGDGFVMMLNNNGQLYGMGDNCYGELGIGNYEKQNNLVLLSKFKEINERVVEVSCGERHVIVRTALNKIFTWGVNNVYQLGLGDKRKKNIPQRLLIPEYKKFRGKPRSVQAGYQCSFILFDNRNLFYTGKIGANAKPVQYPKRFNYEEKCFQSRMADNFTPIKVFCKWSKMMTTTYLFFSDFRKCKISKTIREKFVDQTNSLWNEYQSYLLPPHHDILYQHINYKYLQKINKKHKPNLSHSSLVENQEVEGIDNEYLNKMGIKYFGDKKMSFNKGSKQKKGKKKNGKSKTPLKRKVKRKKQQTLQLLIYILQISIFYFLFVIIKNEIILF